METVAIVGVGLIGGSFALGLRWCGFKGRIIGVSSQETLERALRLGVIDGGMPLERAVGKADLIYLAQPVGVILATIPKLAQSMKPGALVTDCGSTKRKIVEAARAYLPPASFLGGHPMAGKETSGVASAEAKLFANRPYLLTPAEGDIPMDDPRVESLVYWIKAMGAKVYTMPAETHDDIVAAVSHVPQLLSTGLALSLAQHERSALTVSCAGPGLTDMTRLAQSPYEMWRDILDTNADSIAIELDRVIEKLRALRAKLTPPTLEAEFTEASHYAASITKR